MWRLVERRVSGLSYLRQFVRHMGGPSSHLKQLKGLVRKAHLTVPLDHPDVQQLEAQLANARVEKLLRNYDVEYMPRCDRPECQDSSEGLWCSVPAAFPPRDWQTVRCWP